MISWLPYFTQRDKHENHSEKDVIHTRYFIPVTIENRTCDISSATIGTLFLCCVRVWTKIQERCCLFCFGTSVLCMQRKSRNFCINNNTHDARREKPSKTGESSKIERMIVWQIWKLFYGFPPHWGAAIKQIIYRRFEEQLRETIECNFGPWMELKL